MAKVSLFFLTLLGVLPYIWLKISLIRLLEHSAVPCWPTVTTAKVVAQAQPNCRARPARARHQSGRAKAQCHGLGHGPYGHLQGYPASHGMKRLAFGWAVGTELEVATNIKNMSHKVAYLAK